MIFQFCFFLTLILSVGFNNTVLSQVESIGFSKICDDADRLEKKQNCEKLAKIDAIEKVFGSVVLENNQAYIVNVTKEGKTETFQQFGLISNVFVRGKWVRDLEEPSFEIKKNTNCISCSVRGIVEEIKKTAPRFEIKTLKCVGGIERCETTDFIENSNLYLFFKSPIKGYVSVYQQYKDKVYRLLPYERMAQSYYEVERDKEYVFFSEQYADGISRNIVDEYKQSLEENLHQAMEVIYVTFSENEYHKPLLEGSHIGTNGYKLPAKLQYKKFMQWIQENWGLDKTFHVERKNITIMKKM